MFFFIFVQTEVRITDADLHPMFVQVALLQKGDSFVRTQLDVSLSLISDTSRVTHDIPCISYMKSTMHLQPPNFNFCYVPFLETIID